MGRIFGVIITILYITTISFYFYRTIRHEDKYFYLHLQACLSGTEPSQIFRTTDMMMERLHPKVSYEKWKQTVPFYLKSIYIMTYFTGVSYRVNKYAFKLCKSVVFKYVLKQNVGLDPNLIQAQLNLLLIEYSKLLLPLTTMF